MMKTNLSTFTDQELADLQVALQKETDRRLKEIENAIKKQKKLDKTTISDLEQNDKIFCFNFNGNKLYNIDYVNVDTYKNNKEYTRIETSHQTKPMGMSVSVDPHFFDKPYFLTIFASSMYFLTLSPKTWEDDIKSALEFLIKSKEEAFYKEMNDYRNGINNFISEHDILKYLKKQYNYDNI